MARITVADGFPGRGQKELRFCLNCDRTTHHTFEQDLSLRPHEFFECTMCSSYWYRCAVHHDYVSQEPPRRGQGCTCLARCPGCHALVLVTTLNETKGCEKCQPAAAPKAAPSRKK